MKNLLLTGTFFLGIVSADAGILGFGKKKQKELPSAAELKSQQMYAKELRQQAEAQEAEGHDSKAIKIYKKIVKHYPFTTEAPHSLYRQGFLLEKSDKLSKAFDAYQRLIDEYKESLYYRKALTQQYAITEKVARAEKSSFLEVVFGGVSGNRLIEMYEHIQTNAPKDKLAPLCQFKIGEAYQKRGSIIKSVHAYQKVVSDYPESHLAPEAQYRIGQIQLAFSEKKSKDQASVKNTQEAFEDFLIKYPQHQKAAQVRSELNNLTEKEVHKQYRIARFYENKEQYNSAVYYYLQVIENRESPWYQEALDRLAVVIKQDPTQGNKLPQAVKNKLPDNLIQTTQTAAREKGQIEKTTERKSRWRLPLGEVLPFKIPFFNSSDKEKG